MQDQQAQALEEARILSYSGSNCRGGNEQLGQIRGPGHHHTKSVGGTSGGIFKGPQVTRCVPCIPDQFLQLPRWLFKCVHFFPITLKML